MEVGKIEHSMETDKLERRKRATRKIYQVLAEENLTVADVRRILDVIPCCFLALTITSEVANSFEVEQILSLRLSDD